MAFSYHQFAVAILVLLLPIAAKGNGIFPNSPFDVNTTCEQVQCGRGSCEASTSYPFNFRCNCQDGWRRTRLDDDDDDHLQFLPCTIPDCNLDYSCIPAPPPAPPLPYNMSAFDPCYWTYCGEGTCVLNTTHTHTCQCRPGYSNLLNISAFPCYNDCAISSDSCARLGITRTSSTSSPSSNSNNQGASVSLVKLNWIAALLFSSAIVLSA